MAYGLYTNVTYRKAMHVVSTAATIYAYIYIVLFRLSLQYIMYTYIAVE